jgi:hypothetical protein
MVYFNVYFFSFRPQSFLTCSSRTATLSFPPLVATMNSTTNLSGNNFLTFNFSKMIKIGYSTFLGRNQYSLVTVNCWVARGMRLLCTQVLILQIE